MRWPRTPPRPRRTPRRAARREIDSGGRNRNTLPQVPQVSVTTPCWWQYAETAAVRAGSGVRVPGVVQLDRHHRAAAADVADDRVVGLQLAQPVRHPLADLAGPGGEVVGAHLLERAERRPRRRPGCRRSVPPRPPTCTESISLGPAGDRGQRQPAGDALGQGEQVGDHALVVAGEPVAGAAEAGLDLVGEEQHAVVVRPRGQRGQEARCRAPRSRPRPGSARSRRRRGSSAPTCFSSTSMARAAASSPDSPSRNG